MRRNRKLGFRVAGIRKSVHVELFDKYFGRDEQLHRAENAAVMGKVAGTSSREHVLVEGVVHADNKRIRPSVADEMRNVKSKSGVALALMFAGEPAIDPNRGGVKHGSKLHADGAAGPVFKDVERALVPGDSAILGERGLNLPGVGNDYGDPIVCGGVC